MQAQHIRLMAFKVLNREGKGTKCVEDLRWKMIFLSCYFNVQNNLQCLLMRGERKAVQSEICEYGNDCWNLQDRKWLSERLVTSRCLFLALHKRSEGRRVTKQTPKASLTCEKILICCFRAHSRRKTRRINYPRLTNGMCQHSNCAYASTCCIFNPHRQLIIQIN